MVTTEAEYKAKAEKRKAGAVARHKIRKANLDKQRQLAKQQGYLIIQRMQKLRKANTHTFTNFIKDLQSERFTFEDSYPEYPLVTFASFDGYEIDIQFPLSAFRATAIRQLKIEGVLPANYDAGADEDDEDEETITDSANAEDATIGASANKVNALT